MNKAAFASHTQEIDRLSQLLWYYETENVSQRQKLDKFEEQRGALLSRVSEQDKLINLLQKKVKSREATIKFEKIASEGIKKKSTTYEAEMFAAQELNAHNKEKSELYAQQVDDLKLQLQQERCNRLQLVHEKESFSEKLDATRKDLQASEVQVSKISQQNLDNLQKIETLLTQNQQATQLTAVQSEEIVRLNNEVESLRGQLAQTHSSLLTEEGTHAKYLRQMDVLQAEISFLRKQLIMHGGDAKFGGQDSLSSVCSRSQTESSWSSFQPSKTRRETAVTNEANRITARSAKPTAEEVVLAYQAAMAAKNDHARTAPTAMSLNHDKTRNRPAMIGDSVESEEQRRAESWQPKGSRVTASTSILSPLATPHRTTRNPFDHSQRR